MNAERLHRRARAAANGCLVAWRELRHRGSVTADQRHLTGARPAREAPVRRLLGADEPVARGGRVLVRLQRDVRPAPEEPGHADPHLAGANQDAQARALRCGDGGAGDDDVGVRLDGNGASIQERDEGDGARPGHHSVTFREVHAVDGMPTGLLAAGNVLDGRRDDGEVAAVVATRISWARAWMLKRASATVKTAARAPPWCRCRTALYHTP